MTSMPSIPSPIKLTLTVTLLLFAPASAWSATTGSSNKFIFRDELHISSESNVSTASPSSSETDIDHQQQVLSEKEINGQISQVIKTMSTASQIKIVFSDVDGTLVHYGEEATTKTLDDPENPSTPGAGAGAGAGAVAVAVAVAVANEGNEINLLLRLPPSATGMQGVISNRTLLLCQQLRSKRPGVKLVLVSGMRTSTLWKRIPYLPRADAYCSEGGGRIFYAVSNNSSTNKRSFVMEPQKDMFPEDEEGMTFALTEDMDWRRLMQTKVGPDGYVGMELENLTQSQSSPQTIPVSDRSSGILWQFCRHLQSLGLVVDSKGYSTCFRVNRKQQTTPEQLASFDQLLSGSLLPTPDSLATSVNLGCIDYYPSESGKKNCCAFVLSKLLRDEAATLSRNAICLCDDDNDLEMALACHHAYVPSISSESMRETVMANADQITVTGGDHTSVMGTRATELALEYALDRIKQTVVTATENPNTILKP